MPDNFLSGNTSFVKLGALAYQFGKWKLPIDGGVKTFFAFGSAAQRTTEGGYAAAPVVEGGYDQGNMPLTVGTVYALHLGWAVGIEFVVNARLANIEFGVELKAGGDPSGVSCTFQSHGEFTLSFA